MKFTVEIELENDAMQTYDDIRATLKDVVKYLKEWRSGEMPEAGDNAPIRDRDGNPVGKWKATELTNFAEEIIAELQSWARPVAATKEHEAMKMINAARVAEIIRRKLASGQDAPALSAPAVVPVSPAETPHAFTDKDIVGYCSVCGMRKYDADANHIE